MGSRLKAFRRHRLPRRKPHECRPEGCHSALDRAEYHWSAHIGRRLLTTMSQSRGKLGLAVAVVQRYCFLP